MIFKNQYPLSIYHEVTPLCKAGHVILVQNEEDGLLYIKKHLQCYNTEVYQHLQNNPVKNVPEIYGIYEQDDQSLVIIEEYLAGSTLAELLSQNGVFSEKETIDIVMQLCRILMDLHNLKPAIIHRDIKPSNLLLTPEGTVCLLDFNAAKPETVSGNRDTVLLGTAGYAAPEQYGFSTSSPQTDIYAIGVLINTLLVGKLPSEIVADGKFNRIILHCLELNPKDRYRNVKELYYAIKRVRDVKSELLPPGFRTLKWYKMLPAAAGYIFIIALTISTEILALLFIGFMTVAFCCDYLYIQKYFPFMRSKYKFLRILGFFINPELIFFIGVVLMVLFEGIF